MIRATIIVMPKETILDPQGNAIRKALQDHGMDCVESARVGKYIHLQISGTNLSLTKAKLDTLCSELLSNPIIEDYVLNIHDEGSDLQTLEMDSRQSNPQYATRLISHLNAFGSLTPISSKEEKKKKQKKGPYMPTKKTATKKAAPAKKAAAKKTTTKKAASAKKAKK
jgi:phosphoribosylformylglycinamidine synthase PurS subunit